MRNRVVLQNLIIVLNAFLAVTAIMGGIGLASGRLAPELTMLQGSPFGSYMIPGLALLILVGGSALAAAVLMQQRRRYGAFASIVAGVMILGFEIVEVLVIGSPAGLARNLQLFYTALGLVIVILTMIVWLGERRVNLIMGSDQN